VKVERRGDSWVSDLTPCEGGEGQVKGYTTPDGVADEEILSSERSG
jgi:hypothetical protein